MVVNDSGRLPRQDTLRTLSALLLGAALWLLARPFTFSENDGLHYALMAMARAEPGRFDHDLFLAYGSQDAYSVLSPLYGAAVRLLGLIGAAKVLLLAAAGLWLLGSWRLVSRLVDNHAVAIVGFLLVVSFQSTYGPRGILYVGEAQLTGRIVAEALVLLAMAELADRRWIASAALLAGALAVHPLMALPGIGIAFVILALAQPRLWLLVPAGVAATAALALGHIPPFDGLLKVMDGDWLAIIQRQNSIVFLSAWVFGDWARVIVQALVVLSAAVLASGWRRSALIAVLGVVMGGLVLAWVGGDLLHNALIVQLQVWRFVWPLAWISLPAAAMLVRRREGPVGWLTAGLFAAALLIHNPASRLVLMAIGLLILVLRRPLARLAAQALLGVAAILVMADVMPVLTTWLIVHTTRLGLGLDGAAAQLRFEAVWLLVPLAALVVARWPRGSVVVGGLAVVVAATQWDLRNDWTRYLTADGPMPTKATAPVLWGATADQTWFLLREPAFVSLTQASGLLFSREQALEWRRRMDQVHGLVPDHGWLKIIPNPSCAQALKPPTAQDLTILCASQTHPGSIVTRRAIVDARPTANFSTPVDELTICTDEGRPAVIRTRAFFRYDCPASP